jgi:hypothetical protein
MSLKNVEIKRKRKGYEGWKIQCIIGISEEATRTRCAGDLGRSKALLNARELVTEYMKFYNEREFTPACVIWHLNELNWQKVSL